MRKIGTAAGTLLLLRMVGLAHGALWVGDGSTQGPVQRPPSYLQVVASLDLEQDDFDDLAFGTTVNGQERGGFRLVTSPAGAWLVAQAGPVAGAEPASSPMALLVAGTGNDGTSLQVVMTEPADSVGFVVMGLKCLARFKVLGMGGNVIGEYLIPPGLPGERRWLGIAADGWDISAIQLSPMGPGDYAIDDMEWGVRLHEPEPATLLLWSCLGLMPWRRPRRKSPGGRG